MSKKRFTIEQITTKLRKAEASLSNAAMIGAVLDHPFNYQETSRSCNMCKPVDSLMFPKQFVHS
jgi:hypothetical protein